jgi:hypothetical protein
VSVLRGLACEAGTSMRVSAQLQSLFAVALGAVALLLTPGDARADSNREWLEQAFAKSSSFKPTKSSSSFKKLRPPYRLGARLPKSERLRGKRSKYVHKASLGPEPKPSVPSGSATGGGYGIQWSASAQCLAPQLRDVIAHIAANYARVRVNSTCRSKSHNRRVGGAPRSYHLTGNAADIRVFGNIRAVYAYLRNAVGGLKHYGGGLFHIDTGPRRRM